LGSGESLEVTFRLLDAAVYLAQSVSLLSEVEDIKLLEVELLTPHAIKFKIYQIRGEVKNL
jgi:hypothetical protein